MICAYMHAVYAQNEYVILCSKSTMGVITSNIIIQTISLMSRDLKWGRCQVVDIEFIEMHRLSVDSSLNGLIQSRNLTLLTSLHENQFLNSLNAFGLKPRKVNATGIGMSVPGNPVDSLFLLTVNEGFRLPIPYITRSVQRYYRSGMEWELWASAGVGIMPRRCGDSGETSTRCPRHIR